MHPLAPLIQDLAVILGVAGIVALLFQKIKQPVVLGYLIAGIIVGPYTPPHILIHDIENIKIISELGVIFLMFSLGLEFGFHKLMRVGLSATLTGLAEVILMMAIGTGVGMAIGWTLNESIFLGAALAISSTTIIIKALDELNLKKLPFAELIFGILIIEDLLAILVLVGLSIFMTTQNLFSGDMLFAFLKLIMVVGGWFLVGYFLVPMLFRRIMHYVSDETLILVSIGLCLGLVVMAAYFHYSSALGAFIMGSILSETTLIHRIEQLIKPIRNVFAAVFFVSIGMLINPAIIIQHWSLVLLLSAVTILGKLITTGFGALLTGQSIKTSIRVGLSMAQIGEFSFIIAGVGLTLNASTPSLYPLIVAVSALTTFTTPYCIKWSEVIATQLERFIPNRTKVIIHYYSTKINPPNASKTQNPYGQALFRLIINALIIAIIFSCGNHWLKPWLHEFAISTWLINLSSWLASMICASPFIIGMLFAFRKIFKPNEQTLAAGPFMLLSALLTLLELSILSASYFRSWAVIGFLLLFAFLCFGLIYKQLEKLYHRLEKQLKDNLNQPNDHP